MTFWHVIGILAVLLSVGLSLNKALKVGGNILNILFFVLIAAFGISALYALTMPQQVGWSVKEIAVVIIVGTLGLGMCYMNQKVGEQNIKKTRNLKK